jgi:hypothetical protein
VTSTAASTPGARQRGTSHRPPQNWKILATGYHGKLERFLAILETITALEIYRTWSTF